MRGNPDKAVEILQTATPCELGGVGPMYPVYVRGEAFLDLRQGTEAAAELHKILDHRGGVLSGIIGAHSRKLNAKGWGIIPRPPQAGSGSIEAGSMA